MKKMFLLVFFVLPTVSVADFSYSDPADESVIRTASSPHNRVAMLELYTSEGCSSCPPADRFLSDLKTTGISGKQLIPMAFHVTYWDYIGWKDPFAKKRFDNRQRDRVHKKNKSTVYTPQFVLAGDDYRSYSTFSEDVNRLVAQKATVDLVLSAEIYSGEEATANLRLNLKTDISESQIDDVDFYLVIIENNLESDVAEGENEGELLHHDYVVRQILGPYIQSKPENKKSREKTIILQSEWKRQDLSIVAFAENPHTGEVLQAVRIEY